MRYEYESGYENFKKAQRTFMRGRAKTRMFFHLKMWGYSVAGILLLATSVRPGFHAIAFTGYVVGCGLLGGGIVGALFWPWQRKRAYRIWNGDKNVLHLYLEVDGQTLITGNPGKAEARLQRAAVCGSIEDDDLLLLLLGKKRFIYIPKTIGEQALSEIRTWLSLPGAGESC